MKRRDAVIQLFTAVPMEEMRLLMLYSDALIRPGICLSHLTGSTEDLPPFEDYSMGKQDI